MFVAGDDFFEEFLHVFYHPWFVFKGRYGGGRTDIENDNVPGLQLRLREERGDLFCDVDQVAGTARLDSESFVQYLHGVSQYAEIFAARLCPDVG